MDTAEGSDLEKVRARRERHKARGINGNGFGESLSEKAQTVMDALMWPAPQAGAAATEAYNAAGNSDFSRKAMEQAEALIGRLNWSGPKASDAEKAGPNMRGSKGDVPLPAQAMNWAGPTACMTKGSGEAVERADGKLRNDRLDYQAEQFFHPPSSPDHPTIAGGSTCSTDTPNTNQPSVKRKLNPIFVEALMRWPTGLSGFARQEMAWTRWWLLMPSFVSMIFSDLERERAQREMF